jgi:hypothetical protein
LTKITRHLSKNEVLTPAGAIVFATSPDARPTKSKPPAGFGFSLNLNKIGESAERDKEDANDGLTQSAMFMLDKSRFTE